MLKIVKMLKNLLFSPIIVKKWSKINLTNTLKLISSINHFTINVNISIYVYMYVTINIIWIIYSVMIFLRLINKKIKMLKFLFEKILNA